MLSFYEVSAYLGVVLSFLAYGIGVKLKSKFKFAIMNPLLIAIILTIVFLKSASITYEVYYQSAKYISYLLTPATVCLAIPLYEQFELLKKNWVAVLTGIFSGVLTSLLSILFLSIVFRFEHTQYVTVLPKSITTAIGMDISAELGGYVSITVAIIIITGILGNVIAEFVFRLFHIKDSIAKGIALGTASHAIGTAKALELGEIEGAFSSLSIVVAGIMTVLCSSIFANFL